MDTSPHADAVWLGLRHRRVLDELKAIVRGPGGLLVLTGDVGVGKTTMTEALLADLGDRALVAKPLHPVFEPGELYEFLAVTWGFDVSDRTAVAIAAGIERVHHEAGLDGKALLLVVDEAQDVPSETLRALGDLLDVETAVGISRFSVLLAGQDELDAMVTRAASGLGRDVALRRRVPALTPDETREYVAHRLARAGVDPARFTADAVSLIARTSGGIPRSIDALCVAALRRSASTGSIGEREIVECAQGSGIDVGRTVRLTRHPEREAPRAGDTLLRVWWTCRSKPLVSAAVVVALIATLIVYAVTSHVILRGNASVADMPAALPNLSSPATTSAATPAVTTGPRVTSTAPAALAPPRASSTSPVPTAPASPGSRAAGEDQEPRARERRGAVRHVVRHTPLEADRRPAPPVRERDRNEPAGHVEAVSPSDAPDPGAIIDWLLKERQARR